MHSTTLHPPQPPVSLISFCLLYRPVSDEKEREYSAEVKLRTAHLKHVFYYLFTLQNSKIYLIKINGCHSIPLSGAQTHVGPRYSENLFPDSVSVGLRMSC